MQQLSIFEAFEPGPATAKVIQFPQPVSPSTPAQNPYELPELIFPGNTVMLRDGTIGSVKKFAYDEEELAQHNVPKCACEGLREIVVETEAGERYVYAYQLKKISALLPTSPQPENQKPMQVIQEVSPATDKKGSIISFGITTKRAAQMGVPEPIAAGIKICTRRQWVERTVSYYQKAYESGQLVQAWSNATYAPGSYKMADIRITRPLYQEALKDMPESDLIAEGGLWESKEEFIYTVCKSKPNPDLKVWVCWFEIVNICK